MPTENLGDYIAKQIKDRGFKGAREFARKVGVSHNTINRQLHPDPAQRPRPEPETVKKIAEAMGADTNKLMVLAGYPDIFDMSRYTASTLIFADLYQKLPVEDQALVESLASDLERRRIERHDFE